MDADRQKLIDRAKELNTYNFPVMELQERIREVCSEYLVEAKVDVDRLLQHADWRVRSSALDMVWWESEQRMVSTDQLRSYSTILTRTSGLKPHSRSMKRRGALQRGPRVAEAFKGVADTDASDYVRDAALEYLRKFAQPSR